jgi:ribosomal protein S8
MQLKKLQSMLRHFLQSTRSGHIRINLLKSQEIKNLLEVLQFYGYIIGYSLNTTTNSLSVFPRYRLDGGSYLSEIEFYSDLRVYCTYEKLLILSKRSGSAIILLYNPTVGVVSHEVALMKGLGGVLICKVQ